MTTRDEEAAVSEPTAERAGDADDVAAERDMFRDKAHRFIRLAGQYDKALGELTSRIEALIETGSQRATMVVGVSELQAALESALAGIDSGACADQGTAAQRGQADRRAEVLAAVEALVDVCADSGCIHLNTLYGHLRAALGTTEAAGS